MNKGSSMRHFKICEVSYQLKYNDSADECVDGWFNQRLNGLVSNLNSITKNIEAIIGDIYYDH